MVLISDESDNSFLPLAVQQHAPIITLSDTKTTHSRRSVSTSHEFIVHVHYYLLTHVYFLGFVLVQALKGPWL